EGQTYALVANFGHEPVAASVNLSLSFAAARDLVTGERHELATGVLEVELAAGGAVLVRLEA
ncbi:MAG TPA: hypothetical protein VM283_04650, partial [Armatimonadota bacterium]|nr:hypothetical protein [Armatimonadota bacterium]